jgi:predicted nucleic acid-binding protein
VAVIGLDPKAERYLDRITAIRAATGIKLPDAIIAATVVEHDASLVTADRQLLDLAQQVAELRVFAVPPSG